ncbi:AKT-interacting protein isoform X2 [Electrophorus electricus]|uniref:AKT-interacting protein isoform X2 n=1 Tax=Electrophorus electricus TaxID=8005 RepID=UPI0015D048AB|nr:AKT-interacting protein isoform X2 [Electrophorus electricus]
MNPFWSMSTNAGRKRSDSEEQGGAGEPRISPARHPFGKKQLPSIPKNALPITKPSSPASAAQAANGTHASYGPFYLEYSLLAEFTLVIKQKLPGIYVQPSYRSALMWFGVIFIRHGLYQDGVFKFTVYIPDNYPDGDCPRVVFDIPIFHPLVNPVSGELDVKRAFTKWRYDKDIQLFKSKVVDGVKLCNSHLFDQPKMDDPYAISFSPWNPAVHEEAREKMFTHKRRPEDHPKGLQVSGLSWVKPGSTQPFSKDEYPLQT